MPTSRSIIDPARLLCRLAGIDAAAVRFPASVAAALMLQRERVLDSERLALTSALVERKISPKAGIIKSLNIPNSTITTVYREKAPLSQISIYSNITNLRITTPALLLRLVSTIITIPTINNTTIHNGSTMTGGSR